MSRVETIGNGVTLYLGDCSEIMPTLGKVDAAGHDPPWNAGYFKDDQKSWDDYAVWLNDIEEVCVALRQMAQYLVSRQRNQHPSRFGVLQGLHAVFRVRQKF